MKTYLWGIFAAPLAVWLALAPAPVVAQASQTSQVHALSGIPLTIAIAAPDASGTATTTLSITIVVESWVTLQGTGVLSTAVVAEIEPEEPAVRVGTATIEQILVNGKAVALTAGASAAGYLAQGIALIEEEEYGAAISVLDQAIALDPESADAYFARGHAYHNLSEFEAAIEDLTRAIELDPDDVRSYQERGLAYGSNEQYELALADWTKAIDVGDGNLTDYIMRAITYGALAEFELALDDVNRVIRLAPKISHGYMARATIYVDMGEYEQAVADFTTVLELAPERADGYYRRARTYRRMYEWQSAFDDYSRYIELSPDDPDGYAERGMTLTYLGEHEAARQDYDRAIEIAPDDAGLYNDRALVLAYLGEYDEALASLVTYTELAGKLPPYAMDTRAFVYLSMGNNEAAQEDYEAVLAAGFDSEYPMLGLGIANARLGEQAEALEWIDNAFTQMEGADPAGFAQQLKMLVAWATEIVEDASGEGAGDAGEVTPVTVTVNRNSNLRKGPGANYAVVRVATKGTKLEVVGQNGDGAWVQLTTGEWVAASLVDGEPADLPRVDAVLP
jgi:tetratricopeptide (TPR) repeat protein